MSGREPALRDLRLEFRRLAASSATMQERASAILQHLERILVFDAGWLAVRDPEQHRHVPVATTGAAEPLRDYFGRPEAEEEVELLGLNRRQPPVLASEIPSSLSEVRAWADHLLPAGFRQGLAAGLFTAEGRHVGFLSLLSADRTRPNQADRRVVAALTTVIADDLDRTRDIADTARIVKSAGAGVVLTRAGDVLPLPGLLGDRLLAPGSPILTVAADELADSGAYISFLAPVPGTGGEQLIRVVALDFARPDLDHLSAAVLLCPPADLYGLTVLDLRVLGLLVEGATDIPTLAESLHVAGEVEVDSLGRSLVALRTSDLTAAAVRALRGGVRIPPAVAGAI
ncbi:hypothetical protein GCM10017577_74250 [Pseudonocardia halophobica]|uniref:GAF domain-containing protein n=1 Tax=Pseudonocardia halophobica TaxID=29401 RepID=A0A9W6UFH8_9PSEU|nr:GAF domain-containing protein [Pseudonocardia halophobica]GLL16265.1 hypothetical protein GCM10017577_74250 [Pseudonocardia halophobica]